MPKLDDFAKAESLPNKQCSECGSENVVLGFWEPTTLSKSPSNETPPQDYALCNACLLQADGRFKNESPQKILRKYEDVDYIELDSNENVRISVQSELGQTVHIHYTEPSAQLQQKNENQAVLQQVLELTGVTEIFDAETNEWIGEPSPYTDVAKRILTQNNHGDQSPVK